MHDVKLCQNNWRDVANMNNQTTVYNYTSIKDSDALEIWCTGHSFGTICATRKNIK